MNPRVVSTLLIAAGLQFAQTSNDTPAQLRNIRIDQKLNVQMPLDTRFRDEQGRQVSMRSLLRGKPVMLAFVYYSCPRLCSMNLTGMLKTMNAMPSTAGRDYDVITISFDPRDTPEIAAAKKRAYLEGYNRQVAEGGWHFLTGDKAEILRVTNAAGFHFEYDPKTEQFAHASGLILLTPRGRISRYFYGIEYPPRDVRLGLIEASGGKIGTLADHVLLYCFDYDPQTGKYSMTILNVIRMFAVALLTAMALFVAFSLRRERRRGPEGAAAV